MHQHSQEGAMHEQLANHHVLWKGFVSGLAAGLAGTAAMTLFQTGWSKAQNELNRKNGARNRETPIGHRKTSPPQ